MNRSNKCNRCKNEVISRRSVGQNMDDGDKEIMRLRQQLGLVESIR